MEFCLGRLAFFRVSACEVVVVEGVVGICLDCAQGISTFAFQIANSAESDRDDIRRKRKKGDEFGIDRHLLQCRVEVGGGKNGRLVVEFERQNEVEKQGGVERQVRMEYPQSVSGRAHV